MLNRIACTAAVALLASAPAIAAGPAPEKKAITIAVGGKTLFYYLPLTLAEGIVRDIPQAKLVTIPDAGHFVPEERPERVAALLKEFLG